MPLPDFLALEHMVQALDRIAELVDRVDRKQFDEDWVVKGE